MGEISINTNLNECFMKYNLHEKEGRRIYTLHTGIHREGYTRGSTSGENWVAACVCRVFIVHVWHLLNSELWDCIYSCKIDQILYLCIYSFIFKNNITEDMLNLDSGQFDKLTHF